MSTSDPDPEAGKVVDEVATVLPAPAEEAEVAPDHATAQDAPHSVLYVPLAVTIGDGFKFGCGFFLALVVAMLVGFVLVAALFALTALIGLNLPLAR